MEIEQLYKPYCDFNGKLPRPTKRLLNAIFDLVYFLHLDNITEAYSDGLKKGTRLALIDPNLRPFISAVFHGLIRSPQ